MERNPYESPRHKNTAAKGGLRLMTVGVIVMLILLAATCVALAAVAYYLGGLA